MTLQRPGKFDLTDTAIAICTLAPKSKILDVGCGDGTVVAYLRECYGFDAEGIDIDEAIISETKVANPSLPVRVGDGGFLDDFSSFTFDCVMMECSLSLIPMVEEALHEAWCVLKHGGKLIIHDLYDRSETVATADDETVTTGSGKSSDNDHESDGRSESKETGAGEIPSSDPGCHSCDDAHDAKHAGMGTVSDSLRDGLFVKDLLLTAMDDIGYHLLAFEDRTPDLESYAMEMIMAGGTPPLCTEGKKGVGYFMLVAEKPAK